MSKLYIKQKVFSFRDAFTVKDDKEQDKYFVRGSVFSMAKKFTITDISDTMIGTITEKVFSSAPKFFVETDSNETLTIKKKLMSFKTRYTIEGAGLTVEGDWWDKNFTICHGDEVVATIAEKWFRWGDTFEVEIFDESLEHIIISLVIAIDYVNQLQN